MTRALIVLTLIAGLAVGLVAWQALSVQRAARVAQGGAPGAADAMPADYPRQSRPMPAFTLVDQHGAPFDTSRFSGRPTIVSFVFSHCAAMCPALIEDTRRAAEAVGPDRARLVWIMLDPARDTPDSLPALAARWRLPDGGVLVSGPPAEVHRLMDSLGVAHVPDPASDQIAHPPMVWVLDASGRLTYALNGAPVEWIVEGVRRASAGG
jgi:protein SCO1/2